jgi:hypothetical protein
LGSEVKELFTHNGALRVAAHFLFDLSLKFGDALTDAVLIHQLVCHYVCIFYRQQHLHLAVRSRTGQPACNGLSKLLMSGVFEDGHERNGNPFPEQRFKGRHCAASLIRSCEAPAHLISARRRARKRCAPMLRRPARNLDRQLAVRAL